MINIQFLYNKTILKILIFILFLCIFTKVCFAENDNDFNSKIKKCAACHTLTGNSLNPIWPKIAEQHATYLFKQLLEYKKGKTGNRYDPTMIGMLQNIDENDMKNLSNYFAKQILEKSKIKTTKEQINMGKILYLYGDINTKIVACVGCHGIDGTGNKLANFPSLKWQHKEYIITQLKKFKTHDRSNDINSIMRDITSTMSEEQMDALATYIAVIE